jgi:hypothetical protein
MPTATTTPIPGPPSSAPAAPWWARSPGGPILAIVAVKVALTLATDARYGFHRDELYYRVTGSHLAFGYVDFPPVTPLIARLSQAAFGASLVGLRAPALALPQVLSGHNTWFGRVTPAGCLPGTRRIDVEERREPMYWCTRPLVSTAQLRTDVKLFS